MQGGNHVEDQEIFPRLSVSPGRRASYLPTCWPIRSSCGLRGDLPAERPDRHRAKPRRTAGAGYVSSNSDGDDGAPLTDYDLIGSKIERTGLFALEECDHFNLLCIPPPSRTEDVGLARAAGRGALLQGARRAPDRRSARTNWHTADDALTGAARCFRSRAKTRSCTFRASWLTTSCAGISNPSRRAAPWPACWREATRPARYGARRASRVRICGRGYRPVCLVPEDRRVRLLRRGVNTLQAVRSVGRIGAKPRTLAAGSAGTQDWQNLASRRLALFIVNSIERGTRWVIGAEPGPETAHLVTAQVRSIFRGPARSGRVRLPAPRGVVLRRVRPAARRARRVPFPDRLRGRDGPWSFTATASRIRPRARRCSPPASPARRWPSFVPRSWTGSTSWLHSSSRLDREAPVEFGRQASSASAVRSRAAAERGGARPAAPRGLAAHRR